MRYWSRQYWRNEKSRWLSKLFRKNKSIPLEHREILPIARDKQSAETAAMKLVLKNPNEAPYVDGKDISVVITFDDSSTAGKASELLQLVGRKLKGEDGRLFHQWWNTEVLAFNSLRELAAAEAAAADLIIICMHAGQELPEMVASWMKRLITLRKNRHGALIAVLDPDKKQPETSQSIVSQLKQVAASGQMNFFATGAKTGKDAALSRSASEAARQFVLARKKGVPYGLPGEERMSAETCAV